MIDTLACEDFTSLSNQRIKHHLKFNNPDSAVIPDHISKEIFVPIFLQVSKLKEDELKELSDKFDSDISIKILTPVLYLRKSHEGIFMNLGLMVLILKLKLSK